MIIQNRLLISLPAVVLLAGCGSNISPSRSFDAAYFIGSQNADASANGLAFSNGTQVLEDVEGETLTVRLLRFERTPDGGTTEFVASDETVTLPATFTEYGDFDAVITLNGETLVFEDGVATLASGQKIWTYMNYRLEHSGTGAIYTYDELDADFSEGIDTEGFFALGFETDPSVVGARVDRVTYGGSYFGYVQEYDSDSILIDGAVRTDGAMTLEAEFARARISGLLAGRLDPAGDNKPYELIFLAAPIIGNGFVGVADMTCPSGNSCASDTSVSGAFFGPSGEEVSGVITLDETVMGPDGYSIKGAAGFSTTSNR